MASPEGMVPGWGPSAIGPPSTTQTIRAQPSSCGILWKPSRLHLCCAAPLSHLLFSCHTQLFHPALLAWPFRSTGLLPLPHGVSHTHDSPRSTLLCPALPCPGWTRQERQVRQALLNWASVPRPLAVAVAESRSSCTLPNPLLSTPLLQHRALSPPPSLTTSSRIPIYHPYLPPSVHRLVSPLRIAFASPFSLLPPPSSLSSLGRITSTLSAYSLLTPAACTPPPASASAFS
ncbi:hypothetical protein BCV70DRAFT_103310 [Testicularia cyperi]|uniref:Uncharacterized protein n=1 Tax=Testicularia cyperi TaxID=1882483 RepID=A0A317XPD7_9BASI|nr:hypothetical protein BCV70DRAFT_103310 [Testicularia cyperi]